MNFDAYRVYFFHLKHNLPIKQNWIEKILGLIVVLNTEGKSVIVLQLNEPNFLADWYSYMVHRKAVLSNDI